MIGLKDFIGLPWRIGGRDFEGVDCGGLCMLAALHLHGITIPDVWIYDAEYLQATAQVLRDLPGLASRVEVPKNGDVIALQLSTGYVHYGLCVSSKRMLHISEDTKSRLSRRIPQGSRVTYWRFGDRKGGERVWV